VDGAGARGRAVAIGVISFVLLAHVTTEYVVTRDRGRLLFKLLSMAIGLPLVIGISFAGFRWATRRRWGPLPLLLAGISIAGVLGAGVNVAMRSLASWVPALRPHGGTWDMPHVVLLGLVLGLTNFALWVLAFFVPFAAEEVHIRSLEADKLRLEAEQLRTAAELAQLRAHLEPHFLLNTLNAIAGLITDEPQEARRLLVCLGVLLRDALRDEGEMQTLADQVGWLRRYAEILEVRHAGHLVFRWQVEDGARGVLLPRLLLQPLVENAVKHGALMRSGGGGEVVVRAAIAGANGPASSRLVCTIEDNGPGLGDGEVRPGAFGLVAVRRRLALKYAGDASLRLEASSSGTRSIVELPWQRIDPTRTAS
jgi:hypothetical protein